VGIWIEQLGGSGGAAGAAMPGGAPPPMVPGMGPGMTHMGRYGPGMQPQAAPPENPAGQTAAGPSTNGITLVCRAVSLKLTVDPSANNKDVAYVVRDQIAASPMVNPDANATQLVGEISPDDANGTFTFTLNVTPLKPLTF
jgi:hypothetical protein